MMCFRGEYRFLSNFYEHPIVYQGVEFKTTEHAYQALKFSDPGIRQEIIDAPTPGKAKLIIYPTALLPCSRKIHTELICCSPTDLLLLS